VNTQRRGGKAERPSITLDLSLTRGG